MLGGAIETSKIKFKDIESRKPDTLAIVLQKRAMTQGQPAGKEVLHGVPDMIPRNDIGFNQYLHFYQKYPEEELYRNVMPQLTGKSSTDHPRIQRLVHESIGHIPELLHMYNSY